MRPISVDDSVSVSRCAAADDVDGLDMRNEERNEDDVHPDAREHERPQRSARRLRFDRGCESEMTGDHDAPPFDARGQGRRASMRPTTTTKSSVPRMNDMAFSPCGACYEEEDAIYAHA